MENGLSLSAQRRIVAGGSPLAGPVLLFMGWGPLVEDEFDRLRAAEADFVSAEAGEQLAPGRVATLSFPDMSRLFQLQLPVEYALPLPSQRKRGETVPLEVAFSRMTFSRLYALFNGRGDKEIEFVTRFRAALNAGGWEEAVVMAFEPLRRGFRGTSHYQRFFDSACQLASGCCMVYRSGVGLDVVNLTQDEVDGINRGELNRLNRLAAKNRVHIGWLLALFVLLHRRNGNDVLRQKLRIGNFEPLELAAWAIVPDYELSPGWELYVAMRDGKTLNVSKPGPKAKKKPVSLTVPDAAVSSEKTPQTPNLIPAEVRLERAELPNQAPSAAVSSQTVSPIPGSHAASTLVPIESPYGPEALISGLVARSRNVARKS